MKLILSLVLCTFSFISFTQLNMDSLGRLDYGPLHNTVLNDIWGYVDELGNEYAIVGTEDGTSVVDVTNPTTPVEVFWEPGMNSIWRDIKTFGDYAYVTTEASNGLLIIDLSPLPASTALPVAYYTGVPGNDLLSAHNLYIDESGYAYIFGSNRGNGGVQILDVFTTPMAPIEVGEFDTWYAHDGYAQNDTLYTGHISDGFFSIVDVSNKTNPIVLGTHFTPSTFSHNIWTTANGQFAFTTDEVSGGFIGAYDISNPSSIVEIDKIQSSPGTGVIPHNTHVLGDFIVTSYYTDGVVVHDITYPYNMIEVGNYDTHPTQTPDYEGCWGVYPFLTSGNVVASDRSEGLFILGPTYTKAAYLEGIVTDAVTTNPLNSVDVQITVSNQPDITNASGFYATGMAAAGTYDVTYNKVGYFSQTISVNLTNGVITNQNVQLVPIPPYNLTINVIEEGTGTPITGADISLTVPQITHTGATNGVGQEVFTLFYEDNYEVVVGKWEYVTYCNIQLIDNTTGTLTIELPKGYYDDFSFDFGWSSTGTATAGAWERGEPFGTNSGSAPGLDVDNDCSDKCYVTGNLNDLSPNLDDVDGGTAVLTSPVMDLSTYTEPYVNYTRWFHNFHGPALFDDSLKITVSNGTVTEVIDIVGSMNPNLVTWEEISIKLSDFISVTSTMQFFFRTSDFNSNPNITEAGLDKFFIAEEAELSIEEIAKERIVYPNPTTGLVHVDGLNEDVNVEVRSLNGVLIYTGQLSSTNNRLDIGNQAPGVYFILIDEEVYKIFKTN